MPSISSNSFLSLDAFTRSQKNMDALFEATDLTVSSFRNLVLLECWELHRKGKNL
jgi:hypothetical protein